MQVVSDKGTACELLNQKTDQIMAMRPFPTEAVPGLVSFQTALLTRRQEQILPPFCLPSHDASTIATVIRVPTSLSAEGCHVYNFTTNLTRMFDNLKIHLSY
jgi:hypothetical protein